MQVPENFFDIVLEIDNELIAQGINPHQRSCRAPLEALKRLYPHCSVSINDNPISDAVQQIYTQIYGLRDLQMPPVHVGAVVFRDIFFPLRIPLIFGYVHLDPINLLEEMTEIQKQVFLSDKKEVLRFHDQFIDLMDFAYGINELREENSIPKRTLEWWGLARQQLEAAAIALGSFDKYAVIQNCCISSELILKGALIAKDERFKGLEKDELDRKLQKKYGHDIEKTARKVSTFFPDIDQQLLVSVVERYPKLVERRYDAKRYKRVEIGNFLMNAQFIAGEILRQFSYRNTRASLCEGDDEAWNLSNRSFPSNPV
ncbi:hypothetical protein U2F10_33435 [Leptothoe sp. EHU-05/26/07-4]